ncbi:hypothetical protein NUSPORA_00115 [Nucleospora cyclopteri]
MSFQRSKARRTSRNKTMLIDTSLLKADEDISYKEFQNSQEQEPTFEDMNISNLNRMCNNPLKQYNDELKAAERCPSVKFNEQKDYEIKHKINYIDETIKVSGFQRATSGFKAETTQHSAGFNRSPFAVDYQIRASINNKLENSNEIEERNIQIKAQYKKKESDITSQLKTMKIGADRKKTISFNPPVKNFLPKFNENPFILFDNEVRENRRETDEFMSMNRKRNTRRFL